MYDYRYEDDTRINFVIDMKSFYSSVEIVERGLSVEDTPLVVISRRENDGSGLVMSASPKAKELYGISNVMRGRDLPKTKNLILAEPHMDLYIQKNIQINNIFRQFASDADIYSYSIDESFVDVTTSYKLFDDNPINVAKMIQKQIKDELGIVTTIGIGPTLTLAKIALDNEAKNNKNGIAYWTFEDVPNKLWPIDNLSHVWSIGKKTVPLLAEIGINNLYQLAHFDPEKIVKKFGQRGAQLFALSWGVDRAIISQRTQAKHHGIGNSQVLPKDYTDSRKIKLVIKEIAEQTAHRIRRNNQQTTVVHLGIGFSFSPENAWDGFAHQLKLTAPTSDSKIITDTLYYLFDKYWQGQPIRRIAVSLGHLSSEKFQQLSLLENPIRQSEHITIENTIDGINKKFGSMSIFKASSLLDGSTAIYRSKLIGGHAARKEEENESIRSKTK